MVVGLRFVVLTVGNNSLVKVKSKNNILQRMGRTMESVMGRIMGRMLEIRLKR